MGKGIEQTEETIKL